MSFFKSMIKRRAKTLAKKQEEQEKMKLTIGPDGKVQQTQTEEPKAEEPAPEQQVAEEPQVSAVPVGVEEQTQEAPTEERMDPAILREMEMQAKAQAAAQQQAYAQAMAQQAQMDAAQVPPQFNEEAMHEATRQMSQAPPQAPLPQIRLIINLIDDNQLNFEVSPDELNYYMTYCEKCVKEGNPLIIDNNIIPLRSVISIGYTQ